MKLPNSSPSARRVRAQRERLRAAAGLEAHVHAVAVEVLALARDPHQRVEELLVVLLAVGELVLDDQVAGGQDDVAQALGRSRSASRQQLGRAVDQAREVGGGRRELLGQPAELLRLTRARGSARSTGTRPRSSPASRARPGGSRCANARVGGNAALSELNALLAAASVGGSSRIDARRFVDSLASARRRRVEVGDQVLQRLLVAAELLGRARGAADQPREVARRLGAQQRLEHLRGRALRDRDVVERVVEGLRRGLALRQRVGVRVLRGRRLGVQRRVEAGRAAAAGPRASRSAARSAPRRAAPASPSA